LSAFFYDTLKISRPFFSLQVATLDTLDLREYLDHLEGQYFDFDTVIEDFWFVRSKMSNFISLNESKEEKYLGEDVRESNIDLQPDLRAESLGESPIILRVSSALDHHFIIILVGLSLLVWSSTESILKVNLRISLLKSRTISNSLVPKTDLLLPYPRVQL